MPETSQQGSGTMEAKMCKQAGCDQLATLIVHAPSGDTEQCEPHARDIHGLMKFMGANVNFTSLLTGLTMEMKPLEDASDA